jgi:hypothetical protein
MLDYRYPKIFDFIDRTKTNIKLDSHLPKLLMINAPEAVNKVLTKFGIYQKERVFEECYRILKSEYLESPVTKEDNDEDGERNDEEDEERKDSEADDVVN